MKLKARVGLARTDGVTNPGDEFECEDEEAQRLVDAGFAAPVGDAAKESAAKTAKRSSKKETAAQ